MIDNQGKIDTIDPSDGIASRIIGKVNPKQKEWRAGRVNAPVKITGALTRTARPVSRYLSSY